MPRPPQIRRAFTIFELTLVVLIIGIVAAILIPAVGNNLKSSRLSTAANVLAADIEFTASECITRPSAARAIVFDIPNNQYSVEIYSSHAVISHPADALPFTNDFNSGRNAQLQGVTLTSIVMGSGTLTTLTFDAYGRPVITADLVITLTYAGSTMKVTVKKGTGDVSITSP